MKRIYLLILSGIFSLSCSAQYYPPQIIYQAEGRVELKDGNILSGIVTYDLSFNQTVDIQIGLYKTKHLNPKEVNQFYVGNRHYISSPVSGVLGGKENAFLLVITPPESKIKVYLIESFNSSIVEPNGAAPSDPLTRTCYFQIPNNETIYPWGSGVLTPKFSEKMSDIVRDCPVLAKKIKEKEKGYTIKLLSDNNFIIDMMVQIANEYTNCSK